MSKYRTMRSIFRHHKARVLLVSLAICVTCVVSVFAGAEERLIHVFPTSVAGDGWEKEQHALEQVLGERAVFEDFNRQNAAFLIFPEGDSDLVPDARSSSEMPAQLQGAWGDTSGPASEETVDVPATEEVNGSPDEDIPVPDVTPSAFLFDTLRGFVARPAHAEEGDKQANESVETIEPASDEVSQGIPADLIEQVDEGVEAVSDAAHPSDTDAVSSKESAGHENVQEPEESSYPRSSEEDMRSCTVLGKRCHTITFEGFDIGSMLSEHDIEGYTLRLSVAARTAGESFTPDSLMVRYYHRGEWRIAGQVYLDRELSNATEGGHLSFPLPDLDSWDALQDLKVEVEVVRNGTARTEVFLDSVWVDTRYEVASADEETPIAQNILSELKVLEDSSRPDLLIADDQRIELTKVEDVGSDVVIRSDADVYNGLTTARAYLALTNRSDDEQSLTLRTHIGKQAEVVRLLERVSNVPAADVTPNYSEVAYLCEGGWELGEGERSIGGNELETDGTSVSHDDALVSANDEPGDVDTNERIVAEHQYRSDVDGETVLQEYGDPADSRSPTSDLEETNTDFLQSEREVDGSNPPFTHDSQQSIDASLQSADELMETDDAPTTSDAELQTADHRPPTTNTLSTTYFCKTTGEVETCNSFNADKTNCIVGNERIAVTDTVHYEDAWHEVPLMDGVRQTGGSSIIARLFGGAGEVTVAPELERVRDTHESVTLAPHETRFFALDLTFPVQRAGEFVVEALVGGESLVSKSAWWRSAFRYRIPLTVTRMPETATSGVPTLHALTFDRSVSDLFAHAALDGSDVRFYDPSTRAELPTREFAYTYVDQDAQYGVDLGDVGVAATSTVFAYFGNEYVFKDDRVPAPHATDAPIEYLRVAEPDDGVVLSAASERDDLALIVPGGEDPIVLPYGYVRDVLVPDSESPLYSNAPVRVALAEAEYRAGVHSLALALSENTHTTETRLPDGRTEYLLERYTLAHPQVTFGAIEELPIPAVDAFLPAVLDREMLINYLRALRGPNFHQFMEALRDFEIGERPEFTLRYQAQKGVVSRFLRGLFRDQLSHVASVRLLHNGVAVEDARFEVVYGAEGEWTIRMVDMPRAIQPGLYTLEINVDEIGTIYTDAFDFYWGVLAVNTSQATYAPDDTVDFQMAALDDKGDTICDADLRLMVTDPEGNAEEIGVDPQGTCGANNVTDEPDYRAWYRPRTTGTYTLTLSHVNLDGDVVHQVSDHFEVRESMPFTIHRTGATRIWPKASYVMNLELTATDDFTGQFIEAVPTNFIITNADDAETDLWGGAKRIVWEVDLRAGETQTFSYEYDAPDISPYLYLLGPAEVRGESGLPYVEGRQWKLASDATAQYAEAISSFTINSVCNTYASTTLSGVPANAIVEIAVTAANNAGADRSAGVRAVGSSLNRSLPVDRIMSATGDNGYTVHVVADANSKIEACATNNTDVIFYVLGYWTSGTYNELAAVSIDPNTGTTNDNTWNAFNLNNGVGNGHVAEIVLTNFLDTTDYYAGVRPLNSTLDRRVILHQRQRGGHGSQATMLVTASTTNGRIEGFAQVEGAAAAAIDYNLMGYWSAMPTNMVYVDRFASTTVPSLSTTWQTLALDTYGLGRGHIAEILLGNKSHTAPNTLGVRTNGSALSRTQNIHTADSGAAGNSLNTRRMHVQTSATASSTIEYYAETPSNAEFYVLGSWGPSNYSPDAPTLYDVPFESEKTGSSTPYFDFSALDPDGTSNIQYELQWDDDADLDASPLGDEVSTSTNNYFVNTASSTDTSPFVEGDRIRFTIQSALTTGVTYYWRVRARDVTGADDYGEWSDVRSFTYIADTDPKAWYQTEDTQFESGTLSGTETYGADAVRISTDPPTGAMVVYGSGASTTPNVRLWSGTAWSASSSALDVGGRISWSVVRSAPTRNEYILGTQDTNGDVNVQVYDGVSGTWGDLFEIGVNASTSDSRAFDIVYRSLSGDAVVAVCEQGRDPHYAVWDGSSWSATSTIDLTFTTGCTWASLAASPASDEVIFVGQAHPTNAGNDFEAQVLIDTLWGNTYINGNNTAAEEFTERMNVAYEESGDEAVLVVGNANTANFVGAVWNSITQAWTPYTNRATQDDFEWGVLRADSGTDNLALCYTDEDAQVQIANWNGTTNTWDTYVAGTFQVDNNGNGDGTYHARPVSCEYETTTGRDGYLMIPYTDETNARYRVWTGSSFAATEQSISTIEEAWTVGTVRTGDGKILTIFRDDVNDRYDFSYWAGAGWSDRATLESSMSDDTQPYAEPIGLAAQRYQESLGTIVSPILDFDRVPGRPTWGEILWSTTEPAGSAVTLQVYYATTTATCNVLVPDGALAGNSTGFAATSSPLNISGLSTSTYNMLCIKATLTSTGAESPTLDEWSVTWERRPYLTQEAYHFYTNTASYTPSDAWPFGLSDLSENTPISGSDNPPKPGDVLRLRMSLQDENVALSAGDKAFKLQYAEGDACSADMSWTDVAPAGSSTALWSGYENSITSTWYDEDWSGRVMVTIDETYVDETLTDFPVYVNLGDLDASFWSSVNSDGGDIRITGSDGTTEVPREVVVASTTTQTGELYFKATTTSSTTDTIFYLYYGNSSASDYASTSTYGAQNVWDSNYVLVTHMNDRTTSGTLNSAATTNNGTKQSANNPVQSTTALFGMSQDFVNDDISHGDLGIGATSNTLETWVYPDTLSGSGDQGTYGFTIAGASPTGVYAPWLTVGGTGATADEVRYCAFQTSSTCTTSSGAGITTGSWYYIAATAVKSGATVVKVNDTQRLSFTNAGNTNWPTQFTLGDLRPTRLIYFDGKIDEVRVSNVVRSAAWQKATYQNGIGNLVTVSGSESLGDGSTLPSTLLANSDVGESYEESNNSVVNPNAIGIGEEGEWDWVVKNNAAAAGSTYCFRMIGSDGAALNDYTRYPQLVTNTAPEVPVHEAPFDNIGTASTSPWFEFVASDPEGDDVHYEIEVDDDIAFGSPTLDRNSLDHFSEFKNLVTPADKSPFTNGQSVRFTPTTALSNGTTYWWRVRAQDPSGSGAWGEWSEPTSLTILSVSATTWYQTTFDQFDRDTHDATEASSTVNAVVLATGETLGTVTGPAVNFSWKTFGNAWGAIDWTEDETYGTLRVSVEYNTGSAWALVPDSALTGNGAGFASGPVSLLGLDPVVYNEIRLVATLQDASGSPRLNDWTLSWGYAVEQPTILSLFDNEKTGTTTPSMTFYSTDPDADDLVYEVLWSTDATFTTGTTSRTSDVHAGFVNTASSTDTSPFFDGDTIRFTIQSADVLTNGTTYWWRVRARDPGGDDTWSVWSPSRSFTVDTSIEVSTWYQTTDEQFETDTLTGLEANGADALDVTTTVSEAMSMYAENLVQTPRYKLWNGSVWGSEKSAQNIGERVYWVKGAAATTRDEYAMLTGGLSGAVKAQIYTGSTQTFGSLTTLSVMPSALRRGLDVAYESDSGDAIAVACYGSDATYSVWNGSSWTSTSTIDLAFTQNCEWISLASDPESDEIIMIARANPAETPYDFEAQVWGGSSWGNSTMQGAMEAGDAENIGMAVMYEESSGDAVFVTSNNTNPNFHYRTWNGSWSGTSSVTIADDLETPKFARDVGSNDMVMCYVAQNAQLYYTRWTSGAFVTPATNVSIDSNSKDGSHSFDCAFETTAGRDGFIMFPYTDASADYYRYYDTALGLQPETALDTVQDAWSVTSVRTGDGNILSVFWDDVNTQYDFSYWNGVGPWSVRESLETNVAALVSPIVPTDLVARKFTAITSGSAVSDPIVFADGTGPGWGSASSTDTTPGASTIRYQVEYYDSGSDAWALIPDGVLAGNSTGTTANYIDLSSVSYATYDTIRLVANFACVAGDCPTLHDWTVSWTEGLTISGTADEYDLATDVTSGTVAVAVNGVLQAETGTISGGTWSIPNVTFFPGDTVQVWVSGAADSDEAVAVATAVGAGNLTGMKLYEGHLSLGADMGSTTRNVDLALYDYSASSNNEDIFFDVDGGNDLLLCATTGCAYNSMVIGSGHTYRPDSANAGNATMHDLHINGTLVADGNSLFVSGSWDNNGTSTMGTSQVTFTATSTIETIDSTGASSASFNTVTFGQGSGSATWTLASALDVNGNLTLSYGTVSASTSAITLAGNLALGANSTFVKGSATTTLDGTGIATITDSHTNKNDLGKVSVNGSAKTVRLQSPATTTDLTIAVGNTFDVTSNNYGCEVQGDFRNAGTFSGQSGTLYFTATTTGHVVEPGPSSLASVTFSGTGGNWAFPRANVTVLRDLTIRAGIVTFPTGVLSIGQSLTVTGGQFVHNNGEVRMTSTTVGRTLTPLDSPFYDLNFFGSGGAWSFGQTNATTSNNFTVSLGAVTLPSGILYVAGNFENEAGTFDANNGTVHLHTVGSQKLLKLSGSTLNDVRFTGASGGGGDWYNSSWSHRVEVTISAAEVDADVTDFPVYLDLSLLGDHFWSNVQDDGGDIRVTTSDGVTEQPIEVVSVASSTRTGEMYFKAGTLSSTVDTSFYVYYGNTLAAGYAEGDAYGSEAVWTNGYVGVYHLHENVSGSGNAGAYRDSTSADRDGDDFLTPSAVAGQLGNAADLSLTGTTDYIRLPNTVLNGRTDVVVSWWMRTSDTGQQAVVSGANSGDNNEFLLFFTSNTALVAYNSSANVTFNVSSISNNAWRYMVYRAADTANQSSLWLDGVPEAENPIAHTIGALVVDSGGLILGQEQDSVGAGFDILQAYDGYLDEVRFATTTRSDGWISTEYSNQYTPSAFYATSTYESVASRTFTDTNATIGGDVNIESGLATLPTGTLTLRGSFTNAGSFSANNGSVLFATSSTGHTIDVGGSSFYNVEFNHASGGWTLTESATSTNNWTITDAASLTIGSGKTIAVGGTFANSDTAATDWTGSTLRLYSGTGYTVGSKTQAAETYGTIIVGANTDIKLWQSTASAFSVNSTGSLYSQDHAAVDGDLYIWGDYNRTTGTEYWSYATDFDGADISGTPRQVDVRFASGASARFTGASVQMVGTTSASTTLANQGSGTYNLVLSGSTLNARYYDITNTGVLGLALLASTTVTSLSDGAFTLTQNAGSMITASSTTIDTNPALRIERVSFATSSGVSSGYNVTATGTATSYWWFRNSYGNYDGESYDSDPVAGAGSIRWDDSGYTISVSGTVYAGEGTGGAPAVCNGSTQVVRVVVNGGASSTASCAAGTGVFTVPNVTFNGDAVLTAYLDTNGGSRAVTISRTPAGNITGFNLYQNRVIVRHEGVDPLTITQLAYFDADNDTDVPFTASTSTATYVQNAETGLYLWLGKTFAPGGNVTLNSGGSGASYDGSIRLASSSVFAAAGTESHAIGGSWVADSNATFTRASSTVTFTATTTGKTIAPSSTFNNLTLSGTGGGWNIASSTTVAEAMTLAAGTATGTANIIVQNGALSGDGTLAMTGGTVTVGKGGTFGGASNWSFNNLTFGDGTANTTTKAGSGTISVTGTLTIAASHVLNAGSVNWTLTGSGAVLSVAGTFTANTSTTTFAGTSAMTVPALTYNNLVLAPAGAGSPIYTLSAGTPNAYSLTVGNGTNPVTVQADTSDPLVTVSDDVRIRANATYQAASGNDLRIGGSYQNQGTFTANGGGIVFNSSDTGETIEPGNSSFHHVTFNQAGGGWTMAGNATSTGNFTLTAGTAYTQQSGTQLIVQGVFSNAIGGATDWTGTTLYLNSGTSYAVNTKTASGDTYGTLRVGANTDISMWNSTSTTYSVDGTGSLYSEDHNGTDGSLYIWGDYNRASGNEYWSYTTDFDGTDISGTPRVVNVRLAPNATTTLSGGTWSVTGGSGATTTIATQGGGTYALRVTGGTFSAQYYKIRDISSAGLTFTGTPVVSQLGDADLMLETNGGTMMTVAHTVIDANPVKTWARMEFSTSTGVSSGYNVTATGVSVSSWRFIPGSGNYYGEAYDSDPGGNPGYLIFTDSDDEVTIAGNVYSNETGTVSSVCNGSTPVVRLLIEGNVTSSSTVACAAGTGYYEFVGVSGYAPGDAITVYLDGTTPKAANLTLDLVTSISDLHLYENRVVVRHEDTSPVSIAHFAVYDSSDDPDIPFTTTIGPDSVTLPANTKLIVWNGKTFRPNGNVTLTSGGTGTDYDGTLELRSAATYAASTTAAEAIAVGGSWLTGTGATFTAGLSTVTFTATTSGKTVSPDASAFYNLVFNGAGGTWTFADVSATTTNDFTITAGSVTVASSTLAVGGSFVNSAVMSAASTSIRFSSAAAENVTFGGYAVGSLTFAGAGLHTMTDTNATSTGSVTITAGSVALPPGTFAVANGFSANGGTFTHGGTLRLYGTLAAQTLRFGTSAVRNLAIVGTGSWAFADTNATTTGTTTVAAGGLTAPSGTLAVGGSFVNTSTFNANAGHLHFFATSTGQVLTFGSTTLASVTLRGAGGGWTVTGSATTTGAWRMKQGAAFTMASSTRLEVQGVFENAIGGTATDWTNSVLYLNASGTAYAVNTKSDAGDTYAYLTLGANTDVSMWYSQGATTTVHASSSLYSQDHGNDDGALYIYGEYARTSGSEYWSHATDFDGAALGGSARAVDVRIATSSTLSFPSNTLQILGTASATTTVAGINGGTYTITKSGGTLYAQYYSVRNLAFAGMSITGSVTVTTLSNGDFELSQNAGVLLSVAGTVIDQNPSKQFFGMRFASTSGVATGTNIRLTGSSANFWDFAGHYGGFDGEYEDDDGLDACGALRWDDSTCLEVSQAHYRFRADDGGEGAPTNEWYDADWEFRKRVTVSNPNASELVDYPVRLQVPYVSDMLANYDDLRFTDSSGTTSAPYFVESYTAATATVWVKVPSIPAQSNVNIFMYYGNSFAANAEDGAETFTFFDDFEDDNIAEYSGDTSYFDVVADSGAEGAYILEAEASKVGDFTADGVYRTGTTFAQGSTVRFMQYVDSTYDDEPCTLFGVQSPGSNNQNYAVCLDQYPSDRLMLAKNVTSNDASGSILASSTVTWTSGWYTVEVDWQTNNTLYVSVYTSAGTLFATTSVSDSTYTTGGVGLSFWGQHGGWDFYTVRPYAASEPTYIFGTAQQGGGASWLAEQDTAVSRDSDSSFRLRFSVENSGPQITGQQFRLQYAPKTGYGTCAAVAGVEYDDVPNAAGCGVNDICMVASPHFADQSATTQHLDTTSGLAFTPGYLVESPSNKSTSMTVATSTLTEVEYVVELTSFANDSSYCLRTINGEFELDSYAQVAEVSVNGTPAVTEWSLESGGPIYLTEGQSTTVYATGTVTDVNGWEDLLYATSTIYRSGVGAGCAEDPNNCYPVSSIACPLSNCSGNTCDVECTAEILYFAEATDDDSAYPTEEWWADLFVTDASSNVATSTAGAELMTLWGLSIVSEDISYGSVGVGEDTADQNALSIVQNSGNTPIDIEIEGTDMSGGASQIPVANQKFATSTFTYSACVICSALSGTASTLEVDLPKQTSTTTPITDSLYWGLYVPTGVEGTTYYGQNTFYATGD